MSLVSLGQAQYMDGKSALVRTVIAYIDENFITLNDPGTNQELRRWSLSSLSADDSAENVLYLSSQEAPGAQLSFRDPGTYKILLQHSPKNLKLKLNRHKRSSHGIIYGALAIVLGLGIWFNIRPISQALAKKVPVEWETKMTGEYSSMLEGTRCRNPELNQAFQDLLKRIVRPEDSVYPYKAVVIPHPQINAFAFPGGLVVVHTAFLKQSESFEEVAAVLAHEIQHVQQRHVMAHLIRQSLLTGLWTITIGDYAGLMVVDPSTLYQLATLKFSRDDEESADRGAIEMLNYAKINTAGFSSFFKRLDGGFQIPALLSSHPTHANRSRMIEQLAAQSQDTTILPPLMTTDAWLRLRNLCN